MTDPGQQDNPVDAPPEFIPDPIALGRTMQDAEREAYEAQMRSQADGIESPSEVTGGPDRDDPQGQERETDEE